MTASLDTIFASVNNAVQAINTLAQTYLTVQGTKASSNLAAATTTIVTTGAGRLASVSVTVDGSTEGVIYDSNRASPNSNTALAIIPMVTGVWPINAHYYTGLVVVTGTGQEATVIYS